MKCLIKILICVFMTLNIAQGQQTDKGIALYQEGKYEQAITAWLELESIQGRNSKINYNIGLAYYQLKQWPKAILNQEIALKLEPNCEICKEALNQANKSANIEEFILPEFYLARYYKHILFSFQAIVWLLGFSILLSLYIILYYKKIGNHILKNLVLILGIVCLVFALHRQYYLNLNDTVVMMKEGGLRKSPDESSEMVLTLTPGNVLKIKDEIGEWLKLENRNFESGWTKASNIEYIK
jgi:tetratricopeptide (TPR) repeat protein